MTDGTQHRNRTRLRFAVLTTADGEDDEVVHDPPNSRSMKSTADTPPYLGKLRKRPCSRSASTTSRRHTERSRPRAGSWASSSAACTLARVIGISSGNDLSAAPRALSDGPLIVAH